MAMHCTAIEECIMCITMLWKNSLIVVIQNKTAVQSSKWIYLQRENIRHFCHFTADKSDHPLKSHMYCLRIKWPPFCAELVSETMNTVLITLSLYETTSDTSASLLIAASSSEKASTSANFKCKSTYGPTENMDFFESPSFPRYHLSVHWLFTV